MEQAVRPHAMQTLGRHVLQKAPQELVSRERHVLARMVAAVAIGEGDALLVAGDDALIGEGRAMHVAPEVGKYAIGALHGGLGEDDPGLVPWNVGEPSRVEAPAREM
jgi:hypothetical protein